ncbi:hypothetical protein ACJMK2_040608 [Sinanodonta woodiana]|uniref:YqaJ viral recombinase domain-containing protein n=1 Tax=Sinanodonta woodiana TaxID=1069815 RepID=A0ABD3W4E2_SINWO
MGYSTSDISRKPAEKWGNISNEEKARNLFISQLTGFLISRENLFLGVSSKGLLKKCKCCRKGVIEIKCPYKQGVYIHEVHFCDFVVFTSKNLSIIRVKDDTAVSQKKSISDDAGNDNVATYYISPLEFKYMKKKMIQCDNHKCAFQCFHYASVFNVCQKPGGKWYCLPPPLKKIKFLTLSHSECKYMWKRWRENER